MCKVSLCSSWWSDVLVWIGKTSIKETDCIYLFHRSNPLQLPMRASLSAVPPKIRPFHFPPDLSSGSRTRLTCEAAQGDLPLSFQWQHQGRDLTTLPGIIVASVDKFSSTISITKVKEEHGGNYTCIVQNTGGVDQYSAVLRVNGKHPFLLPT